MHKTTLISLLDASGMLRIARYVNRNRPIILMYHRILRQPLIPGIAPDIFDQHLDYLKNNFRVIAINRLVEELETNSVKPYTVAITFDDGHEDFYTNAWPLLKKYEIPASLYITTGFIDKHYWLWPDLLRYLVIHSPYPVRDIEHLGPLSFEADQVLKTWNRLGDYCLALDSFARAAFLQLLAERLDLQIPEQPQHPFVPLNWTQLREMHSQGLDIGSHSVSHPILSKLSDQDLLTELALSQQRIQDELGKAPTGICYPNGMADDVSPNVERQAQSYYRYGLVAYPSGVNSDRIMHLGRWGAADEMLRFKQVMNGFSRNDNHRGEYR